MKQLILFSIFLFFVNLIFAQSQQNENRLPPESTEWYYPVPPKVKPGDGSQPPSDAIILFNGTDFSNWLSGDGDEVKWTIKDDAMVVEPGTGGIHYKGIFW